MLISQFCFRIHSSGIETWKTDYFLYNFSKPSQPVSSHEDRLEIMIFGKRLMICSFGINLFMFSRNLFRKKTIKIQVSGSRIYVLCFRVHHVLEKIRSILL
ncbi:hypothetical protein Hanom_Chr01g00088711 [Helianthus anomalus]